MSQSPHDTNDSEPEDYRLHPTEAVKPSMSPIRQQIIEQEDIPYEERQAMWDRLRHI